MQSKEKIPTPTQILKKKLIEPNEEGQKGIMFPPKNHVAYNHFYKEET